MADDFGLSAILGALEEQKAISSNRQKLQVEQQHRQNAANAAMADVSKKSAGVSQSLMDSLAPMMDSIADLESGAQEQQKLRGSNSVGDFLAFVGNEVMNPTKYTKAGRQAALAETSNLIAAKTQVASLQQGALADVNKVIESDLINNSAALSLSVLQETQANERLTSEVARIQHQAGFLAANRSIAEQKMAMMSSVEIQAAHEKAAGKSIDVGGVILSAGDLETRMTVITERGLLQEQRNLAQDAKRFDLDKKLARKELETMNLEELRPMLLKGSALYELTDIESVYDIKLKAQTEESARTLTGFKTTDFGGAILAPAIEDMQRIESNAPTSGMLGAAVKGHKAMLVAVTTQLAGKRDTGIPLTVEDIATANLAIESSQLSLNLAIDKEAKLKARGDKDLLDIYTELYRGNPVPQSSVDSAITTRLKKGQSLDDIMPPEVSKSISKKYNARYQELLQANQLSIGVDKESLKEQAMQEATQSGIQERITGRTRELYVNPLAVPGHPLSGRINDSAMYQLISESDAKGALAVQQAYGLNDEEMSLFLAGKEVPGGKIDGAAGANLMSAQTQEFLTQLDAIETGLAKKYVDWWNVSGNSYISETQKGRLLAAKESGVQESAFESYAAEVEAEQSRAYVFGLNSALESYNGLKTQRYKEMVTFDLNPRHMQAVLLQLDKSLDDSERKSFMRDFVLPLIDEAEKNNASFEDVNILIENAIESNVAPNPVLAKILKKVSKERQGVRQLTEDLRFSWKAEKGAPAMGFSSSRWAKDSASRYGWYDDVRKGK